ncbi:hypothetical protein [Ehrlichia muris]|uniref:hypothetical protein n=1 Tax=Ehrlichia muris TaxID=35795 RepID=UPI00041712DE|nr:hypothetical protein [Ehrlichia muris]
MLKKVALVIFYLYITIPYSSLCECSDASIFYTLDELNKHSRPFCDVIFKEVSALDFRIVPFYMQSFFDPKLFLKHPSKGLKLVPERNELLHVDFKSMMSSYKKHPSDRNKLADYGIVYYGMHRRVDDLCVYYNSSDQCIKQCLPIPALRRPVLKNSKEHGLVAEVKVRSVIESNLNRATGRDYRDEVKEMSLRDLSSVFGESVDLIQPKMNIETHEFETKTECTEGKVKENGEVECTKTVEKVATESVWHDNIECLKGLNYVGKGYYIKKYDKTIGGHRYFWLRLNKKKLVRHIYDGKTYYPCDDSMSYDLDSMNMMSFVTSIKVHDNYYIVPRFEYSVTPYKENTKRNLCKNSELYFYIPTYLKEIEDKKECIFGKLEYSSDEAKHTKSCLYSYTSDDFQTFGPSRNKSELEDIDFIVQNDGVPDGLVERNLYFEGMCVDRFPKYEYKVKKFINGTRIKRYVYEIDSYRKCDFIKVEAWGGGQAGYIKDGKAYSGLPAHYTLGILKTHNGRLKGKKLVIYVGEGGRYPEQYGEDTVVALCDSDTFDGNCEISFVARGCTHNGCEKNDSFINDDIVAHYRSATGIDFTKQRPIWLQYYRFIPWGNPNFPDGTIRLNPDDCAGPVNAFEKNPNQYPGSGGCANLSKSIQQGADGLVRLTCEVWSGNTTRVQNKQNGTYSYDKGRKLLCSTDGSGECLKSVCIYSTNTNYMISRSPVTMFGEECKPLVKRQRKLLANIFFAGNKMTVRHVGNGKYCYQNHEGNAPTTGYSSTLDYADYYGDDSIRINRIKCWRSSHNVGLSCYRSRISSLKMSEDKYVCCYHNMDDPTHSGDICWREKGADILNRFNDSDLPPELRQNFDDGSKELLTNLPLASKTKSVSKAKTKEPQNQVTKVTSPVKYNYDIKKQLSYLHTQDNTQYLKTINAYLWQNNDSVFVNMLPQKEISYPFNGKIISDYEVGTDIRMSCNEGTDSRYKYYYNTLKDYRDSNSVGKQHVSDWKDANIRLTDSFVTLKDYRDSNSVGKQHVSDWKDTNIRLTDSFVTLKDYRDSNSVGKQHVSDWKDTNIRLTDSFVTLKDYRDSNSVGKQHVSDWKDANIRLTDSFVTLAKLQKSANLPEKSQPKEQVKKQSNSMKFTVKMEEETPVNLQYAYYQQEKTFCLDTTDKMQNKGCLTSLCIYSQDGTFNNEDNYKLTKEGVNDASACLSVDAMKSGNNKIGTGIKMICSNDDHCCYHNGEIKECIPATNLALSCYRSVSNQESLYTCCYSDITRHNLSQSEIRPVCWKGQGAVWQILGYYKLPEETRKQVNKEYDEIMVGHMEQSLKNRVSAQ